MANLSPLFCSDFGCDVLVMGDFNCHHETWFSSTRDDRVAAWGLAIIEPIESSPLCLLNEDSATRLPRGGRPSSSDLSIARGNLSLGSQ